MTKVNNKTNEPPKLLIFEDAELSKTSKKVIGQIFDEIRNMRNVFQEAGITPFDREAFIRCMNEGYTWMTDYLYEKLKATYIRDGFSEKTIENLKADEKPKLEKSVILVAPIIERIKNICTQIDIDFNSIVFEDNEPTIDETIRKFISERSKYYAVGKEQIELYKSLVALADAHNATEKLIAKSDVYPQIIVEGIFDHVQYFEIDFDTFEDLGYNTLKVNPRLFEEIAQTVARNRDFIANGGRRILGVPSDKTDVPAGEFKYKLSKEQVRKFEEEVADPSKRKGNGRWGVLSDR
jgi:hypothetical protein